MEPVLLDAAGRRRSPATLPGYHHGRPPRNKGLRHPTDPPTVEEIVAVMRCAGDHPDGLRMRGLIIVLWRAGLRISERSRSPRVILTRRAARSSFAAAKAASAARSAWTLGRGSNSRHGCHGAPGFRSARCSASSTVRPRDGRGQHRPRASRYDGSPRAPVCADASLHTSYVTHTPSRWHVKACRSSSSNANSGTRTSASRRSTSKTSTTPRSSKPSTPGARR